MNQETNKIRRSFLCVAMILCWAGMAMGAELSLPPLQGKAGQEIEIPVIIDQAEKLAGIKLVLEYDPQVLSFSRAAKTKQSSSLLHVVNDKKPGALIIVMAGARGINGLDFPFLTLTMTPKRDIDQPSGDLLRIVEAQLMNDQLQEIRCTIKKNTLRVKTETAEKPTSPLPSAD